MLGSTADELRQVTFAQVAHPDDVEQELELTHRLIVAEIDHFQMEKRFIRKDGQMIWTNLTASAIRDPGSPSLLGIGMIEDITQRKLAQAALQRRDVLLDMLAGISEQFLRVTDALSILPETLAQLGQAVEVSRVHIYKAQIAPDRSVSISLSHEWVAAGIKPMIDHPVRRNIAASDFGFWKNGLTTQGTVYGLARDLPLPMRDIIESGYTLAYAV